MNGAPSWKIGDLDVWKTLTVAGYIGIAAALSSVAQAVSGVDFSSMELLGVNGSAIALAVTNLLVYASKRIATDTTGS